MGEPVVDISPDRTTQGVGAVVLALGGLGAAFGVASCCGLPFLLATAGLGTAWLGGVALLAAPHRQFLLVAAAASLAGAAGLLWQQRARICVPGAVCTRPIIRGVTVIALLLGVVFLYIGYAYA